MSSSVGNNGIAEPEAKRRRILDAGGPIEDDETARQKMRDAKVYKKGVASTSGDYDRFDPNDVSAVKGVNDHELSAGITAMGYFAKKGDLPMMRWLYVNGADTRDEDVANYFPMLAAARRGRMDICKWLFQHGAAGDIKRRALPTGETPLSAIFDESGKRELSRWLILNGALCKDDNSGELDIDLMQGDLDRTASSDRERPELLKWAKVHHQSRSSFYVFLMGTLSAPAYSATKLRHALMAKIRSERVVDRLLGNTPPDQYRLLWDDLFPRRVCPLVAFSGKSGILELIGAYVGIMRGREARVVRQLTEPKRARWLQHAIR